MGIVIRDVMTNEKLGDSGHLASELEEICMGSIHTCSELSIEDGWAIRPISRRNGSDRIPTFKRGASTASGNISAKETVSGTMYSSFPPISSATAASVHDPSTLIRTASIKCTSIEGSFGVAPIPGDIEAPGSVSVDQAVDVKYPKNDSATVGREGERQHSYFDHGSMSWFAMCFKGRVQA